MRFILCVDDHNFFLQYLESVLPDRLNGQSPSESQYQFEFINNPLKLIKRVEEITNENGEIALLISDYNMPDMNGLEMLEKVVRLLPHTKTVLLTGNDKLDLVIKAVNSNLLDKFFLKDQIKGNEDFILSLKKMLELFQMEKTFRLQRQQLIQSDRMASVGVMAAGVAHEINNPLNIAIGDIFLLKRDTNNFIDLIRQYSIIALKPEDSKKIESFIENIDLPYAMDNIGKKYSRCEASLNRIKKIIENFRNFTQLDTGERALINIEKSIKTALNIIPENIKTGIEIVTDYLEMPQISCFGREINQVFMNVLLNAFQVMNGNGTLTIKTKYLTMQSNKWVLIKIIDTGPGIPVENISRIFDPFFTTKPVGEGAGLGLSTCHTIMENHNGEIFASNNENGGTIITIKIPNSK